MLIQMLHEQLIENILEGLKLGSINTNINEDLIYGTKLNDHFKKHCRFRTENLIFDPTTQYDLFFSNFEDAIQYRNGAYTLMYTKAGDELSINGQTVTSPVTRIHPVTFNNGEKRLDRSISYPVISESVPVMNSGADVKVIMYVLAKKLQKNLSEGINPTDIIAKNRYDLLKNCPISLVIIKYRKLYTLNGVLNNAVDIRGRQVKLGRNSAHDPKFRFVDEAWEKVIYRVVFDTIDKNTNNIHIKPAALSYYMTKSEEEAEKLSQDFIDEYDVIASVKNPDDIPEIVSCSSIEGLSTESGALIPKFLTDDPNNYDLRSAIYKIFALHPDDTAPDRDISRMLSTSGRFGNYDDLLDSKFSELEDTLDEFNSKKITSIYSGINDTYSNVTDLVEAIQTILDKAAIENAPISLFDLHSYRDCVYKALSEINSAISWVGKSQTQKALIDLDRTRSTEAGKFLIKSTVKDQAKGKKIKQDTEYIKNLKQIQTELRNLFNNISEKISLYKS